MKQKRIHSSNPFIQSIFTQISLFRRSIIKEGTPSFVIYELLVRQTFIGLINGDVRRVWELLQHRLSYILKHGLQLDPYQNWMLSNEPIPRDLKRQAEEMKGYVLKPLISIVTPVFHPAPDVLKNMLGSVAQQSYGHWEHCIVNADPDDQEGKEILRSYAQQDQRFLVKTLDQNEGIAANTNEALKIASGEWIAFLDHDDQLAPFALAEVVKLINQHPDTDVIYTDEDKIRRSDSSRFSPFFKPEFNLDYLRSLNYMTHFLVVRASLVQKIGGINSEYDGAQDYDLVLKLSEVTNKIRHIPKVLYHWTAVEGSAADSSSNKGYALSAGEKALEAHLQRSGLTASVESGVFPYQAHYEIMGTPKISMIIPSKDNCATLKRLLDSIFEKSTYPNYEIIIVENGSQEPETFSYYGMLEKDPRVRIVVWKEPFNYSLVNNMGEEYATGEVLLLLNNDLEVITGDWLERMLEHAQRPEIGAVGAKLLYPNNTIQHGGVIVGLFGAAGHSHKLYSHESPGYYNRLITVQNYSAVTAACLMIRRSVYREVDGLDPSFKLEFGDVDFCLRVLSRGYRNLWTPHAQLYHHESLTRGGYDTREKQQLNENEVALFQSRWKTFLEKGDPSYNPNLTYSKEDFDFFTWQEDK